MTRHPPPVDTLQLSREEEQVVFQQASAFLQKTLALETEFRRQGAKVDTREWKEVSAVDDFFVYKQRKAVRRGRDLATSRDFSRSDEIAAPELMSMRDDMSKKQWRVDTEGGLESTAPSTSSSASGGSPDEVYVPQMLCTGSLEGKLEDFMYGIYDGNDLAWRLRSAYLKDKLADSRILATIRAPNHDDPFRFLGIKWFATEYPGFVGTFAQDRETLVLEAMGMAKDENGESYGYYLMHDFTHPSIPIRTDSGGIRQKFNVCFIHRQVGPDRILEYGRGYVDPGGNMSVSKSISTAAASFSSVTNAVDAAYNKKLTWVMATQRNRRAGSTATASSSSVCQSCHKASHGVLSRSLLECDACGQFFCGKCIVERKLVVDIHTTHLHPRALPFCFGCVLRAKQLSSYDVARMTNIKKK
ncbi:hypothetical protein Poli38472_012588 [Pythium oligandrum]|uniref:FYVE-type domain-containing protein n=1 Tax=Pythium oligandrum TaxID=41045 RepID=A0A8K1FJ39_PYTOL|nr:hypothetical protein Poli38472_012588 [Pythium oligandrum]|eukprot:TMW61397.1 hypothetical protein Poli38472_012588 [Pythium oligandrum]